MKTHNKGLIYSICPYIFLQIKSHNNKILKSNSQARISIFLYKSTTAD